MQLVLDTHGISLRVRGGAFLVSGKEDKRTVSPKIIRGIMVMSDCLISSDAVRLAIREGIPLLFFDEMGNAAGRVWSAQFDRQPRVRRHQVLFERDRPAAARWAAGLYRVKAGGQLDNLRHFEAAPAGCAEIDKLLPALEPQRWTETAAFEEKLMQIEAQIARYYWEAVGALLPPGYAFKKRTRQPAADLFNAALNYLYGMLYNTVEGAAFAAGLDPFLGIVHADEYNKPTLAFDLIEPFRAWIDRLLIEMCRQEQLQAAHFDLSGGACTLNRAGKRLLIPAYEALMNAPRDWQGRTNTARNHIFQFAGEFSNMLEQYQPKI